MLKKIKKVIAFALALTMLMGMGTMVSAAEKESSIPEYSETNDGGMTVNIAGDQEGTIVEGSGNEEGINPLWWPGDGPAPQVTSISLYKYGWLTNGNFGVTIKVYGYGSDTTTFDGRSISWIHQEPLRKREVIDLIQLSGQQTSLILHVPFQRYSRLVQTNIC